MGRRRFDDGESWSRFDGSCGGTPRNEICKPRHGRCPRHAETVAEIVCERDAELGAGFHDLETGVPGFTPRVAPGAGRELPPRDMGLDVALRTAMPTFVLCQQRVNGLIGAFGGFGSSRPVHGFSLYAHVGMKVDLRCLNRVMAEPECDDGAADAASEQFHGDRVA